MQCHERGHHDPGLAELRDQSAKETPGRLGIEVRLNQDAEHISIAVNRPTEPVFHTTNDNHHLIKMPLVVGLWPVPANAAHEMPTKTVHPVADRFPADENTPRSARRSSTSAELNSWRGHPYLARKIHGDGRLCA